MLDRKDIRAETERLAPLLTEQLTGDDNVAIVSPFVFETLAKNFPTLQHQITTPRAIVERGAGPWPTEERTKKFLDDAPARLVEALRKQMKHDEAQAAIVSPAQVHVEAQGLNYETYVWLDVVFPPQAC